MLNLPATGNRILLEAIPSIPPSIYSSIHPSITSQRLSVFAHTLNPSVFYLFTLSVFINLQHIADLSIINPSINSAFHPSTIHSFIHPVIQRSICLSFPQNQVEKIGFSPECNCLFFPFPQSSIHSHVPLSQSDCTIRIFPGSNSNYYIIPFLLVLILSSSLFPINKSLTTTARIIPQ